MVLCDKPGVDILLEVYVKTVYKVLKPHKRA